MLNNKLSPFISSCIANNWMIWRIGIVLLKFTKIGTCLQYWYNSKIHYGKYKWTKNTLNGLIQDEAELWQNCLTNINNNSLCQDKNDINSLLVMSESLHGKQQHTM